MSSEVKADLIFQQKEETKNYKEEPYNIEAEQNLLGTLLSNNNAHNYIGDLLHPDHFYEPVHSKIFSAIVKFIDKGIVATPVTLKNFFAKDEALSEIGGAEYLVKLVGFSGSVFNVKHYAEIIYDEHIRRSLIGVADEINFDANNHDVEISATTQIEKAEQKLFNLALTGSSGENAVSLKSSLNDALTRAEYAYKRQDKIVGLPTGFMDLDNLLGGLHDSDLLILAGRPSMGKTAFAVNIAVNAAKFLAQQKQKHQELDDDTDDKIEKKGSIGFFSLEMSHEQLASRIMSMESAVNSNKIRTGKLTEDDFTKLVASSKDINELPIFIDDTPALTISALRARARRLKRQHDVDMIIIDYLQLLRSNSAQSAANRVVEISEITQGLKAIAKELNIPIIALSQLSRAVEQREDKRPQLSDLRESGTIEQDSDIVMFIYRPEYYLERKKPNDGSDEMAKWQSGMQQVRNLTEIIIAKQRHGPIGTAQIFFEADTTKFKDLAKE